MRKRFPWMPIVLCATMSALVGCQTRDEAVRLACIAPQKVASVAPQARGQALANFIEENVTNTEVLDLLGAEEPASVRATRLDVLAAAANLPDCDLATLWSVSGPSKPATTPPTPAVRILGQRSTNSVIHAMQRLTPAMQACYDAGLERNRSLSGVVMLRLVVAANGTVVDAEDNGSSIPDATVIQCLLAEARKLVLEPEEGGDAIVLYPVELGLISAERSSETRR